MNRKAQQAIAGWMIAIILFIAAVQMINPMKSFASTARNSANLDCDNSSITLGEKSTCVMIDFFTFYFIGMALVAGAVFFGAKFLIGRASK